MPGWCWAHVLPQSLGAFPPELRCRTAEHQADTQSSAMNSSGLAVERQTTMPHAVVKDGTLTWHGSTDLGQHLGIFAFRSRSAANTEDDGSPDPQLLPAEGGIRSRASGLVPESPRTQAATVEVRCMSAATSSIGHTPKFKLSSSDSLSHWSFPGAADPISV